MGLGGFCFIHAADLHLDTPFEGIARSSDQIASELRDASLDAFDSLIRLAIERNAAFVVFSGDIYDGAERGIRAQIRFRQGLERLSARGVASFIVHGNHDPLDGWSAIQQWPAGVKVFGGERVETVPVVRDGKTIATVHGISYSRRDVSENLALKFARSSSQEDGLQIGVLHCNLGSNSDHAAYSPCTLEELARVGLDYWALGHVHQRQVLKAGNSWVVYPGNLQGRSPKPSEAGAKGAVVVQVSESGSVQSVDFAPLDKVRFIQFELDVSELSDIGALVDALAQKVEELRSGHIGRGLVLRAVLGGRSPLHSDLRRADSLPELLKSLREQGQALKPFVWWNKLIDETRPMLDLESIRQRGDFSSELLKTSDELSADTVRFEKWVEKLSSTLPQMRLSKWISGLSQDEKQALLENARILALDLLEERRDP